MGHILLAHLVSIVLNLSRYGWNRFLLLAPPSMGSPLAKFSADYGYPLWMTFVVWVPIIAALYPACRWYASYKRRHHYWLLQYL